MYVISLHSCINAGCKCALGGIRVVMVTVSGKLTW